MLEASERFEIARLWERKLQQDRDGIPQQDRHRNLEPASAEFLHALVVGVEAKQLMEIGGSSGLSTIALASAARATGGQLRSIEMEPQRQAEARETAARLGLDQYIEFILADAAMVLPSAEPVDFVFIDCEKEDYIRFFDMLRPTPGAIVVADNIISHSMGEYVDYVRSLPGVRSVTLPVGKGLEVSRFDAD